MRFVLFLHKILSFLRIKKKHLSDLFFKRIVTKIFPEPIKAQSDFFFYLNLSLLSKFHEIVEV